jgi:ribosomal protein L40E
MEETSVVSDQPGLCPKCGAILGDKAIVCPKCGVQTAKPKPDRIVLTMGQKIAAAVLILNGLVLVLEAIITQDAQTSRGVRSAIVSIILGGYLFTGRPSALVWAKVAVILGAVLFTAIAVAQADLYTAVFQMLFSLSLIGLLFGRAGKIRLAVCVLMVLGYFGLEVVGLYMLSAEKPAPDPATQSAPKT